MLWCLAVGGKALDSREQTLEAFLPVVWISLLAVTHLVNYDISDRTDKYCQYTASVARTGRTGREGVATSFITDHDEGVLYDLRQYLEPIKSAVPRN